MGPPTQSVDHLALRLGREQFAIPVSRVQEIMSVGGMRLEPPARQYLKGLVRVHGRLVPVLDPRLKLGSVELEFTPRTRLVVLQTRSSVGARRTVAMIVDGISRIVPLRVNAGQGTARINGHTKRLLDVDHLLTEEEAQSVEAAISTRPC
jgi:chemotaxis signal transduction protein